MPAPSLTLVARQQPKKTRRLLLSANRFDRRTPATLKDTDRALITRRCGLSVTRRIIASGPPVAVSAGRCEGIGAGGCRIGIRVRRHLFGKVRAAL
ncbi:hypothetical protein A5624_11350 [Mycobacterium sp. 1482292.6]|nr:hypothetical protein A5624_11350 [Mycobacterium sp. 1482292.6]